MSLDGALPSSLLDAASLMHELCAARRNGESGLPGALLLDGGCPQRLAPDPNPSAFTTY